MAEIFDILAGICSRPKPFEFYTADILWNDDHISKRMLEYHLSDQTELASRTAGDIDKSVEWIVSEFNVCKGTRVADFGCGPGLYSERLAKSGAEVTGIDFSERSIDYARNSAKTHGLSIEYVEQNYLDFESEDNFDLILMIYYDFCALSPDQRSALLGKFRKLLRDNGRLLLDVLTLTSYDQRDETAHFERRLMDGFWSHKDYYGFMNTFKYDNEKVVLDKYSIIEEDRSLVVYNWLQYFSRESIESEFADNGLKVVKCYSDMAGTTFAGNAAQMAIIAERA